MKSDVRPEPQGPWDDDATTRVDPRGPRAARHRNLLRCVLLLHSHATWSAAQLELWKAATGGTEVSARALLEAIVKSGVSLT